jgi:hypothetical protein
MVPAQGRALRPPLHAVGRFNADLCRGYFLLRRCGAAAVRATARQPTALTQARMGELPHQPPAALRPPPARRCVHRSIGSRVVIGHRGGAGGIGAGGRHRDSRFRRPVFLAAAVRGLIYRRLEEIRFRTGVTIFAAAVAAGGVALGVITAMSGGPPTGAVGPRQAGAPVAVSTASSRAVPAQADRPLRQPRRGAPSPASTRVSEPPPASAPPRSAPPPLPVPAPPPVPAPQRATWRANLAYPWQMILLWLDQRHGLQPYSWPRRLAPGWPGRR